MYVSEKEDQLSDCQLKVIINQKLAKILVENY